MSRVTFALGAEADIASADDVSKAVRDGLAPFTRRGAKPIRKPLVGVSDVAVGGAVPTICRIHPDGPAEGRVWDLRNICIIGADDHTAGAFPGALYVGGIGGGSLVNFSSVHIVDTIPSVPFSETYSSTAVLIAAHDVPFVVLYNVTAGLQYITTARVDDWAAADVMVSGV